MKTSFKQILCLVGVTIISLGAFPARAQAPQPGGFLGLSVDESLACLKASSGQVSFAPSADAQAPGIDISVHPGQEGYPGVTLTPARPWDLSRHGHVDVQVTNVGTQALPVMVRLDSLDAGGRTFSNTESSYFKPGEARVIKVIFGYSYGLKPSDPVDPAAIVRLLIFTQKPGADVRFRVTQITAAGAAGEKPPVDPESVRTKPVAGHLLGGAAPRESAPQFEGRNGATVAPAADGRSVRVTLPAKSPDATAVIKPAVGRWDLREYLQVRVTVRNDSDAALTPRVRLGSNGGSSDWAVAPAPLAPGATLEIVAAFAAATPWRGESNRADRTSWGQPGTGTKFGSDAVSSVVVGITDAATNRALSVLAARAELPPPAILPDWVGKRPPVDGDWVQTFDEAFNGDAIDDSKWNIYGPNYWDKRSHFSQENVILGNGVVRLRYAKKHGFHNDDTNAVLALSGEHASEYATGFLDTYGKWTQRYGYFEARMKLPSAPGLWPAFWLMPDRRPVTDPQWKRQDTANGGMEFDIMEHLDRWGIYRYTIAMHWDGYEKNHKQTGASAIYVRPDGEGFITSGLLWLPGLAVFYANGDEVARWESERIANVPADIMFTLPMGGWDNDALVDARLPDDFVIDYVRVWQRLDLAAEAGP